MEAVTLRDESIAQHGFYVPQFEIRIEGVGLPRDVLRDVTQVTYKDNIKEIDGFEITVNNWDADTRTFKYVGAETGADLEGSTNDSVRYRLFEPCNKQVEVRMGYLGDLRVMLKGTFTTMEPNFPQSGAPTLAVRGLNALHQLRRKQYSTTWGDKSDSDIAENIATLEDKDLGKNHKRFPIPIVVNDKARSLEDKLPYVAQKSQYDIDFLLTRAKRLGYVVYIREGDPNATNPSERKTHLYFGPSDGRVPGQRNVTFRLRWGASLIDFKPTLTTANQVKSVTVNGWDRTKKKAITVKATLDDKELNVNQDLHELLNSCDPREEIVVDKPVHSEKDAKAIAQAILKDRHKEMVKASVTCIGLPDLRAGGKVEIVGLGARFSGTYFVTNSTHTINDSGYITKFNARREVTGPLEGTRMTNGPQNINGVVVGLVKEIDEHNASIKVEFPWLQPPQPSHWAPVATLMSGKDRGVYYMPELDDEVLIAFEHGKFDHPYVVGFLWNGADLPPGGDQHLRLIKSVNGHQIALYDPPASAGDKGYIRVEDAHGNKVELANGRITITGVGTIQIQAPSVTINGRLVAPVGPPI